jgi:HEAT repeat protein
MLWWKRHQLRSSHPAARVAAAAELASAGDRKSVPALIECLADKTADVRQAAARALGSLKHPASVKPLAAALERACSTKEHRSAERSGSDARECETIALALGALGAPAGPPLILLLGSENRDSRRWAARALGVARNPFAVDALIPHLGDARSEVRKEVAIALGHIADTHAVAPLITSLNHKDPETRRAAAEALGEIGATGAVEALQAAGGDPAEAVQVAAVTALGRIGGLRSALGLRLIIDGSSRKGVREAAGAALEIIQFNPTTPEERAAIAVLKGDFAGALREGSRATRPLIDALASRDPRRRALAAEALGSMRSPDAVHPLARLLRDVDGMVQAAAASALAAMANLAVNELRTALESEDPTVQRLAAEALGKTGNPAAAAPLAAIIETSHSFPPDYPDPLEAARAAAGALQKVLDAAAADVAFEDLERIASLPDITAVPNPGESGERTALNCGRIRGLAVAELLRRRAAIQA